MKDSFFIAPPSSFHGNKRKRLDIPSSKNVKSTAKSTKNKNNNNNGNESDAFSDQTDPDFRVGDIDEMDLEHHETTANQKSSLLLNETDESAQEKRVRLAKEYIQSLQNQQQQQLQPHEFDASEIDRELIESRLRTDVLESEGKLRRQVREGFNLDGSVARLFRGHSQSPTSVAILPNEKFLYSGGKEGTIIKYSMQTGVRVKIIKGGNSKFEKNFKDGHCGPITCLAISHDGKYLASGGKDKKVCIWDVETDSLLHVFAQHRDQITGLAFRKGSSNSLYSSSDDRTIKVYNIDEMAYVETLFGHQDKISAIDSMGYAERCVSTGSRDRTVRVWKIIDESQLVFRANAGKTMKSNGGFVEGEPGWFHSIDDTGSVDNVCFIDDDSWITGSDGGTLSLWNIQRKKPICSVPNAHGRTLIVRLKENENQDELNQSGTSDEKVLNESCGLVEQFRNSENSCQSYLPNIYPTALHIQSTWENIEELGETLKNQQFSSTANWITALAAFPYSNMVASGSNDGFIRIWRITSSRQDQDGTYVDDVEEGPRRPRLVLVARIGVVGYVNSLRFSAEGKFLVAAVGQEHKNGRWGKIKKARNGVFVIPLGNPFKE